jgi:putative transposase
MAARYRLAPTAEQTEMLIRHCADARFVWNLALEQFNMYDPKRGPTPNRVAQQKQLAEARKGTWLGEGSSSVQQVALADIEQAKKNWWAGTHGRPTWRVKGRHESFCVRDVTVRQLNRKWATVNVPKLGPVKFRLSRPLPDKYGMGRVSLDRSGRWHIAFAAPQPAVERTATGAVVGIDRGVKVTAATSDGAELHCPTPTRQERARRARLQRKLARQCKKSKRREVTRRAIAKLTARQADRRKDWVEKTSTELVREYDLIVFEDLRVRNMVRSAKGTVEHPGTNVAQKRGLNRSISEQGWTMLERRTTDKVEASDNCQMVKVPAHGTSQTCSACGHRDPASRTAQATFHCTNCGHAENADRNASKVIRAAGLAVLARGGVDSSRANEPRTPQSRIALESPSVRTGRMSS